jgi:SAM-dependent methyltransferase
MVAWHEEDGFWETVPLFGEARLELAPEEVDAALSLLGADAGAAVLDLCCGVGRHSLALAQRGYRVTGVDRTAAYLQRARERAMELGLEVEWVEADMRDFARPGAFHGAINLFSSFGYFEDPADDAKVAGNLFRSLKPGGRLVMEMMGKEILARIFAPRGWEEAADGTLLLQERAVARDWTWMEARWIVVQPGGQRREFAVGHRIYDGAGLRRLLLDAGFSTVEICGRLGGEPYDAGAQRLVAVARKTRKAGA